MYYKNEIVPRQITYTLGITMQTESYKKVNRAIRLLNSEMGCYVYAIVPPKINLEKMA